MMENNKIKKSNRLSGRYEIIEQIGIGGMSYVYKAYDSKKKKVVAIKMLKDELALDNEFVNKFKTEAEAARNIKHENVMAAYDVVDEGNMHYIVMEYLKGTTLNKYIKNKGKLTNEETIDISIQIAKGIKAAHVQGIIHRDIKPQNIVINDDGLAKITDFGIARAITSTTKNISVVGTVHYISPEQVRNTAVDFRSDIYSLGCTMYEMITGIVPFGGDVAIDIVISHLKENIKAPHIDNPTIYPSLEKIILKASRMSPDERYQSMDEMIGDLCRAIHEKDGNYIKDTNTEEDDTGKTVVLSDDDMKVIKAVSEKYVNKSSYKEVKNDSEFTPEQKLFFEKYIKNGAYKQHVLMRRLSIGAACILAFLFIAIIVIQIDTRKKRLNVATGSIAITNIASSLNGVDIELARTLVSEYKIKLNAVGEEYNDLDFGKIISVVKDDVETNKSIDVILSKGPIVMDFSDKDSLQQIRWSDMLLRLNDRKLDYEVTEIDDNLIPKGYIIGVNKSKSDEPGKLMFTISKGIGGDIKTMPDLAGKTISAARDLLKANELAIGNISFIRDYNIPENCVIKQSVEKGSEVRTGTTIDITLSCGPDGVEYIADTGNKWYSELSTTYRLTREKSPNVLSDNEKMIVQIRLMQETNTGVVYTELMEPQEYKIGTVIPLVFERLEGNELVREGEVQVVDVVNDVVLASIKVLFWPEGGNE